MINSIEGRCREIRSRTRPMGSLAERSSVERVIFAVLSRDHLTKETGTPFLLMQAK